MENKEVNLNLELLAEQIFTDLNGTIPRATISEVLAEVVTRYAQAPVQTFVPIFVQRDAISRLLQMQPHARQTSTSSATTVPM